MTRNNQALNLERNRASAIIDGDKLAKKARPVEVTVEEDAFADGALEEAMKLPGFRYHVTNIPDGSATMPLRWLSTIANCGMSSRHWG
ncbi:hypothetical protein D3I60_03265 [Brevibacterium permense]|nr:hypothetical protein [Brevibacterium permense]